MRDNRICNFDFLAGNLDHGLLLGLTHNDHNQYLLRNGDNSPSGTIDWNSQNIDNIGDLEVTGILTTDHIAEKTALHTVIIDNNLTIDGNFLVMTALPSTFAMIDNQEDALQFNSATVPFLSFKTTAIKRIKALQPLWMAGDNIPIYFGAATDASIHYQPGSFIIRPDLVNATDYLRVLYGLGHDGIIEMMAGNAQNFRELWRLRNTVAADYTFNIDSKISTAWVSHFQIIPNATVANSTVALPGNLTVATTVEVAAKSKLTSIGGYAIKLTNKTGANSVAGELVETSVATVDAVSQSVADSVITMGVFLDDDIADGSEAWIVVSGIVDVKYDAAGASMGDWVKASGTAGRAESSGSQAPGVNHFREIGHALEDAGANALGRIVMHFN